MDDNTEAQIAQWRGYVQRHQAISGADVDEMESHLRDQVGDLETSGLSGEEAFLVAVKRMGNVDAISREFAREHSDRLWKQLVLPTASEDDGGQSNRDLGAALVAAVGAGLAVKIGLAGFADDRLGLNIGVLVLPFLAGYFAWKRQLGWRVVELVAVPFVLAACVLNFYPFDTDDATGLIAAIHAPIALWLVVGLAYVGGDWRSHRRRMDFVRFTGELAVYFALLAIGSGILIGLTVGVFGALDIEVEPFVEDWVLPCCVPGAFVVAAWLVEAKQSVIENIAPVLTRVFTPLVIIVLAALFVGFVATGNFLDVERDLLIQMDLILVLVLGLLLYAISARDPLARAGLFDRMQLVLVAIALAVDMLMLAAMLTRTAEFGFTANKTVALGMNLVLAVNLVWSLWLGIGFVRGRRSFGDLERWQTHYLPVYGAWAAIVVVAIGPLFGFV